MTGLRVGPFADPMRGFPASEETLRQLEAMRDKPPLMAEVDKNQDSATNSAKLAEALAAIIPTSDPVTTTRVPTRELALPAGTLKFITEPFPPDVMRSLMGFTLRTAGEKKTVIQLDASAPGIMRLNGCAHSLLEPFTLKTKDDGTDPNVIVQKAFQLFWDNTALSPTQAARSSTENHFEGIDIANCRYVMGAQFGRDGDNNQVDADLCDRIHVVGSWFAKAITGVAATDIITAAGHGYITDTDIVMTDVVGGAGLPAIGTTLYVQNPTTNTFQVALTPGGAVIDFTTDITAGRVGPASLWQDGIKYGSGVFANNLLHHADFASVHANRRDIHVAGSQFSADMAMLQQADTALFIAGIKSFLTIKSGRSENCQRLIATSGGTTVAGQVTVEDFDYHADVLRSDGRWIQFDQPGILNLPNVKLINPPAGITPVIRSTPPGGAFKQLFIGGEVVSQQAPDTLFSIDAIRVCVKHDFVALQTDGAGGIVASLMPSRRIGTVVWDPPNTVDGAVASTTVTVTGAVLGDRVMLGFTTAVPAGALLVGAVTAADTVTVTLFNHTGGAIDLASGTLTAEAWKY